MIKKLFLSTIFIFVSSFIAAQSLRISPSVVRMGDIKIKSTNTVTLICVNVSDKPIVIRKIETGCTCVKSTWSKSPIMPGDSVTVTVTMIPTDRGAFYKSVLFMTAPKTEKIPQIVLRGKVE